MKKYGLKKNHYIKLSIILIFVVLALIFMGTAFSLWSTKLNIFGKVDLELHVPHLDVSLSQIEPGKYTNVISNKFVFVKDEYNENSLITTVRADNEILADSNNLVATFTMKNLSKNDKLYENGTVTLVEHSNGNNAVSNVSAYLSKKEIKEGESDIFVFNADIDRDLLNGGTYYKYEIVYSSNGIKKNFFYTINILPAS